MIFSLKDKKVDAVKFRDFYNVKKIVSYFRYFMTVDYNDNHIDKQQQQYGVKCFIDYIK